MNNKLATKVLALAAGAVMGAGMFTTGVGAPTVQVEAADPTAAQIQMLKAAFDANFYANKYADVKKAYGTDANALWAHFLRCGMAEGRMENANFDPKAYIQAYSDVAKYCNGNYAKAYEHYLKYGQNEDRNLTTFALLAAMSGKGGSEYKVPESATVGNPVVAKLKNNVNYGDKEINIGYGLTAVLTADQMKDANITIMQNGMGYGAYLNGDLIASTPYYGLGMAGDEYVKTIDISVNSLSDVSNVPWGNDIATYHDEAWDANTTDYHHYTNGVDAALIPWATTESVDWAGTGSTPYIVAFGFGDYNPNYVETGVVTYSPATGYVDSTETGTVTDTFNPWNYFK